MVAVALLWFVNLVNFMDGIDWMTVAEVVPLTAGLALFGLMGALPRDATFVALALCGAMIGFAPFNRPVARLFLGDVGSLPIGLLLGWLLIVLAGSGHIAAALLLPLYYLADATITLLRRLINGEPVMQAHRSHFYQRATDGGFSVYAIVGRVLLVNIGLIALAVTTLLTPSYLCACCRARRRLRAGRPAALPFCRRQGLIGRGGAAFERHAAGNADTQHIDPALLEIEQMRIDQRTENILRDDHQPDPGRQASAAEQQQMRDPHRP